ncbi:type VI secretion system baseplate subunit TssG [Ramlibacter sp. AW1]|uniref:Type VI secretion system baseplate subunit TssG n=1 Tax=Ramlibacter aurantiacus TaxID=2801330 RepID=A0A937D577_9BURK|nr:type VI secretion system baseplate subunit TssG [Ramlibacter aurantiacus]MBL0419618.1 type VI secretion system baseplate subunit TssG [Ramlibacter aurantiacus]
MQGPEQILAGAAAQPWSFDFYALLRSIEARSPERPRLGTALRPAEEPLRLGQSPELSFAPAALAGVAPAAGATPARVDVRFFGLFGPNGPLPLHLTGYARERLLNHDDRALARFADLFHHRLLLLFYRAWAQAQPTASADRPGDDRFANLVGALVGIRERSQQGRDEVPDDARRFFAGHFSNPVRSADGLSAVLSGWLRMPVQVVPFAGTWMDLPPTDRTRIGGRSETARLGAGAVLGASVWDRQHHFGLRIGPLRLGVYESLLPDGAALPAVTALTRFHVGHELGWTLELELQAGDVPVCRPGQYGRLGWTTWIGRAPHRRNARVKLHPPLKSQKEGTHG